VPTDILVSAPADGVVLLTLNRPAKRNALSIALRDEVTEALGTLAADDGVKVVIRIAADTARFAHPEQAWSDVVYGPLHDLVGAAVARDLCFTGRSVPAGEAKALDLVSRVVAPGELAAAAAQTAALIARARREVLVRTKAKAIRRAGVVGGVGAVGAVGAVGGAEPGWRTLDL
jgi:enoyl-CoA hydratase/carnithine racemase